MNEDSMARKCKLSLLIDDFMAIEGRIIKAKLRLREVEEVLKDEI